MSTTITCEQCGNTRRAAYRNTKYCIACALLRDLLFVGDRTYECKNCDASFAPIAKRDDYCGACAIGCGKYEPCALCPPDPDDEDLHFEQHRAGVALCVRCVRNAALRQRLIRALRNGQAKRRAENGMPVREGRSSPTPRAAAPLPPLPFDLPANRWMIDLKKRHPKPSAEPKAEYLARLLEAGILTIAPDRSLKEA